jgi:hypothetical protein
MNAVIPANFPRESILASVSGFQNKITARKINGKYITGLTEDEILERYSICEDLAQQLANYCLRKVNENPDWTHDYNYRRAILGVANKVSTGVWRLSDSEQEWIAARTKEILSWSDVDIVVIKPVIMDRDVN